MKLCGKVGVSWLPCVIASVTPKATLPTPSVTTKLSIPTRVTSRAESRPHAAHAASTITQTSAIGRPVWSVSHAVPTSEKPVTLATDRSIWPATSGSSAASATIPITAWSPRIDLNVSDVRNVEDAVRPKKTISSAHTTRPLKRVSCSRWSAGAGAAATAPASGDSIVELVMPPSHSWPCAG